jgi:hypothetical protein
MGNSSRDLRDTVVRAMAKVGLVWAVTVLAALFIVTGVRAQAPDGGYALSAATADHATSFAVPAGQAPRTAGLALALVVLGSGITVLAIGACRGDRETVRTYAAEPDLAPDLPLALGLGLLT